MIRIPLENRSIPLVLRMNRYHVMPPRHVRGPYWQGEEVVHAVFGAFQTKNRMNDLSADRHHVTSMAFTHEYGLYDSAPSVVEPGVAGRRVSPGSRCLLATGRSICTVLKSSVRAGLQVFLHAPARARLPSPRAPRRKNIRAPLQPSQNRRIYVLRSSPRRIARHLSMIEQLLLPRPTVLAP